MQQTCQNKQFNFKYCEGDFTISEDHKVFCDKIGVPYPTWCPMCRMTRRLSFVNAWNVYFKDCDKCGERTMSAYRPDLPIKVYCQPCYWADSWDGTEYGREYDSTRPFLQQWRELQLTTPHCALETTYLNLKNSEFCNGVAYLKNCYLTFWADYCDDVYYSSILNTCKDSVDILRAVKSELCYDSVGIGGCSKTHFSDTCDDCVDVMFSRNCYGCINCIGCVNLRGQSYMILNQKYSREEYFEKVKELQLDTREGLDAFRKVANNFIISQPVREYTGNTRNYNVENSEYIFDSKNTSDSYMCIGAEDSKYCQFITVASAKDCYDYSGWGNGVSQMYECGNVGEGGNNCKFSFYCYPESFNIEYSAWCISGKNNFGCSNLKRKSYAILNKIYDKETYEKLIAQIKQDMIDNPYIDSLGRVYGYGEFFPPEFSLFPYNDTNGCRFLPMNENEALVGGYNYKEKIDNTYIPTLSWQDLPQSIKDTNEIILNEIINCRDCGRAYKIVEGEYTILKKIGLPVPDCCSKCRESKRFAKMNLLGSTHNTTCGKCGIQIKTSHKEDKIVYCVKCYQQELV